MPALKTKRIYDPPGDDDGARILVDRLWPRGISRDKAAVHLWLRDIAPSDGLRKRFHGHPEDWEQFRAAYAEELREPLAHAAVQTLREHSRHGPVTLLFAARDAEHNNAVALRAWLRSHPGRRGRTSSC
jgi:uncharacterized protein YeaO (DUF488 family)